MFPSISVFSNESVLRIRWPKYWSFSFNISPSSESSGLISFRMEHLQISLCLLGHTAPPLLCVCVLSSCGSLIGPTGIIQDNLLITSACAKSIQSCLTLCDLVDCSLPGSSVHGILQARILEGVTMPSSRESSRPKDRTRVCCIT